MDVMDVMGRAGDWNARARREWEGGLGVWGLG